MEKIIVMEKLVAKLNNPVINKYPELEDITITPSKEQQQFNSEKYGYDTVTVEPYIPDTEDIVITPYDRIQQFTSNKDGYKNITVEAVDVELPELEDVRITPSKEKQVFKPEKYGFDEVTVEGYVVDNEDIIVTATNEDQTFTSDKDGYKNVTVKAIDGETLTVTATDEVQIFEGLYDNVIVNEIIGETLNIKPTTAPQTFNGLYKTVNVEKVDVEVVETEEVTINPNFKTQDIFEVTATEGKYITKATVNKDVNLVPENILKGISVYGIDGIGKSGIDTSDATATASDILKGKTAYVNGKKIVGTFGKEYRRLEYIENANDEHYIDTGVKALSTIGVELTVQTKITRNCAFFGGWSGGNGLVFGQNLGQHYMIAGSCNWIPSSLPLNDCVFHKFVYDAINKKATTDGVIVGITPNAGVDVNIWMFRGYEWSENSKGVRISRCKLYDNGTLIRDYVPVIREEDNLVCMYDLVEQKFAIPSGSGSFIAGPEIV